MTKVFHLLYRSQMADHLSYSDLEDIIGTSRLKNEQTQITSLLINKDDFFIHLLEGSKEQVQNALSFILMDERATALKVLYQSENQNRLFVEQPLFYLDGDISANSSESLDQLFDLCMQPGKIDDSVLIDVLRDLRDHTLKIN